jgi:hypothetical protein
VLTLLIVVASLAMILKVVAIIAGTYLLFRAFSWVHQASPRLAWILVGVVALAGSLAALGVNYLKRAKVEARAEARAEAQQQRRAAASQAREEQALAAVAERKHRSDLTDRWRAARRTTIEQWRRDLIDARAVGGLGVTPPMLSIQDTGSLVTITNRSKDSVCVLISRIATRDSAVMSRCTVGSNRCVVILGGATARWPTLRAGNSESCLEGSLEYRVGNVDHPDPSWWSETALGQFGSEDPDPQFFERWSDAVLTTEIVRLEKQIEDRMRVER